MKMSLYAGMYNSAFIPNRTRITVSQIVHHEGVTVIGKRGRRANLLQQDSLLV